MRNRMLYIPLKVEYKLALTQKQGKLLEENSDDFFETIIAKGNIETIYDIDSTLAEKNNPHLHLASKFNNVEKDIRTIKEKLDSYSIAELPFYCKSFSNVSGSDRVKVIEAADLSAEEEIKDAWFSTRVYNSLTIAGIKRIGELVQLTESEVLKIKGLSKKSVAEIKERYNNMNLCFGINHPVVTNKVGQVKMEQCKLFFTRK